MTSSTVPAIHVCGVIVARLFAGSRPDTLQQVPPAGVADIWFEAFVFVSIIGQSG
jgi:hypothetical protein